MPTKRQEATSGRCKAKTKAECPVPLQLSREGSIAHCTQAPDGRRNCPCGVTRESGQTPAHRRPSTEASYSFLELVRVKCC
jgi:hypothetical protein